MRFWTFAFIAAAFAAMRTDVHAFVARSIYAASEYGDTYRYAVRAGVPSTNPSLTYAGWHAPVTVDSSGTFYAESGTKYGPAIGVFPPGSNAPTRGIVIRNSYSFLVESGLGVDRGGYAFVFDFDAEARSQHKPGCADSEETLVYQPSAHGFAQPLDCYLDPGGVNTVAFDSHGDMYVPDDSSFASTCGADGASGIDVYTNPRHRPQLVRHLYGESFQDVESIALDRSELFVLDQGLDPGEYSYVAVYSAQANGQVRPLRTIAAPTRQTWTGSIAVDDRYAYITAGSTLLVYAKAAHGHVAPIAQIALPLQASYDCYTVAVGP